MNHKRIIASVTVLGLALVLAWGCQNSKPVGPMKYVSLNATISTKGIVKPSRPVSGMELMFRITGPSMNPVSGKVTVGSLEPSSVNSSAAAVDYVEPPSIANFTVEVPAGPSRTLAVQLSYIPVAIEGKITNPNDVIAIGATRFDIDPGTPVVDVPVEMGDMCSTCCWLLGGCYSNGLVAYMGNTDLVNCAFVPNDEAFFRSSCDAKRYFYGDSGPVDTVSPAAMSTPWLETGDVFCEKDGKGGHRWVQVGKYDEIYYRYNSSLPYYAFDPNVLCYAD